MIICDFEISKIVACFLSTLRVQYAAWFLLTDPLHFWACSITHSFSIKKAHIIFIDTANNHMVWLYVV